MTDLSRYQHAAPRRFHPERDIDTTGPSGTEQSTTSYFIQSRPTPDQPWQQATGITASWESKPTALDRLAARREMQPSWEHRLMERRVVVTEQPATEA